MYKRRIAFICTGNLCRSPMAEYIMKAKIPENWDVEVISRGVFASAGQPASSNAAKVAQEEDGIDMSLHISHPIGPDELRECDLIFTMSGIHKKHLELMLPDVMDRVYQLTEFGREGKKAKDIEDPIGGDIKIYKKIYEKIKDEIERIIPIIGDYLGYT